MTSMNPIERIQAVLSGEEPDRPPYSFWHHFPFEAASGQAAVDAHLQHLHRYHPDFLKVMHDNEYPTQREIRSAADLRGFPVLKGDEEGYGRQLELIRSLSSQLAGKVYIVTTMFNTWATLRRVLMSPTDRNKHGPPVLDGETRPIDTRMSELLTQDRTVFGLALDAIAASQANFTGKCIEAGADGVFLSVRDDWVNTPDNGMNTYEEMVQQGDLQILAAAGQARMNMLHVCGRPQNLKRFADYPVQVINWADRAAGPAIKDVIGNMKPVVCGGVDNLSTLPGGRPEDVAREVRDALQQACGRAIIISPGCTFDPQKVPEENLDAIVQTVQSRQG